MRHNKHSTETTKSRFLGTISTSSIRNLLPSQNFDFLSYLFQFLDFEFSVFWGNKVFWLFYFTSEFCCSESVWVRSIFVLLLNGFFFFGRMFELIGYWFIYFDWLLRIYWKWKGCYFCCCWFNFFIMNKKKRSKWANSITDFFFIIIFSILMYKCSDWLLRNFFKMKRMPIFLIYLVSLYWTKKKKCLI